MAAVLRQLVEALAGVAKASPLPAAGGRVAGVFFNRAQVETPGFLRAFLR